MPNCIPRRGAGAAVQRTPSGVTVTAMPLERLQPGTLEVLVEILTAALCAADVRSLGGGKLVKNAPKAVTLGHEAVGRVVKVGRNSTIPVGATVVIQPHIVPPGQRGSRAYTQGDIFRLQTLHAGMDVDGCLATHVLWPAEHLRVIPQATFAKVESRVRNRRVHPTAVLAEVEHVACVHTAFDLARRAEKRLHGKAYRRLCNGGGKICIWGGGWMGWLWFILMRQRLPNAEIWLRDPDEGRRAQFRQMASEVFGVAPAILHPNESGSRLKFDWGVLWTSARTALPELFQFARPGGHIILASGIDGGAVDVPLCPADVADCECIHRNGLNYRLYRTAACDSRDTVIVSGTSGYSLHCFDQAIRQLPKFADCMAAGMTGVVSGDLFSSVLSPLRHDVPGFATPDGRPVLPVLLAENWLGRRSHLKIVVHPNGNLHGSHDGELP